MKQVQLYTDGSCINNPGPGASASILVYGNYEKVFTYFEPLTTNNRMELMAVIMGLEAMKEYCKIEVHLDSKYVMDGYTRYMPTWKLNGWRTSTKSEVKNKDLWLRLDSAIASHEVTFNWVKGHNGHHYNERCDQIARECIEKSLAETKTNNNS